MNSKYLLSITSHISAFEQLQLEEAEIARLRKQQMFYSVAASLVERFNPTSRLDADHNLRLTLEMYCIPRDEFAEVVRVEARRMIEQGFHSGRYVGIDTITRNNSYLGKWTLTFNGKVSHHFRKAEAQARAVRLVNEAQKAS